MNTLTVLVVDDEEDSRIIYSTLLRCYGYEVLEAVDGEEGLRVARQQRPDLILMDLRLPRLNGWAATQQLKCDPQTAHIPIVALTVHATAADQERAHAVGFDSYLVKPCRPSRALEEVRRLIGPSAPQVHLVPEREMRELRTALASAFGESPGHDPWPGLDPPMEILLLHLRAEGRVEASAPGRDGEVRYKPAPGYTWETVLERARALTEEIRQQQEGSR